MKRKIIIGLASFTTVFLLSGAYVARMMSTAAADLNRLVTLHQVESLREQYLMQLKGLQLNLALKRAPSSRNPEMVVADVVRMGTLIDSCFQCHHSQPITEQLNALKAQTGRYADALRHFQSGSSGADVLEDPAFPIGEELIGQVRDMIEVTAVSLARQTHRTLEAINHAKLVIYAVAVLGPLLAASLGFVLISGLTRPLGVLLASARKLKGGDLDHRVTELPGEFKELALSFNEMAGSLKEQMNRMQRTEQMAVVGQLAAGLAHEIKNPLGVIKLAMQLLPEEANLSEDARGVVKGVSQEVVRLEALMKNFLDFATPPKAQLTELSINDLINMILAFYVKTHSPSPNRSGSISISKDLQPIPETLADPVQLQQVLLNLILNAVESMPDGGTLSLRTFFDNGHINIEVADTGRGISAEHLDKIFVPFFTTKPKGTGLGLAISKQLIEQHGGSITVAARPTNGTVFRVKLPWLTTKAVAKA